MLREIVTSAAAGREDMQVVGTPETRESLLMAVGRTAADVVILGLTREEEARAEDVHAYDVLLYTYPRLKVLAVTGSGRHAILYELRPHRTALGNVSPEALLAAVRSAVASGTT